MSSSGLQKSSNKPTLSQRIRRSPPPPPLLGVVLISHQRDPVYHVLELCQQGHLRQVPLLRHTIVQMVFHQRIGASQCRCRTQANIQQQRRLPITVTSRKTFLLFYARRFYPKRPRRLHMLLQRKRATNQQRGRVNQPKKKYYHSRGKEIPKQRRGSCVLSIIAPTYQSIAGCATGTERHANSARSSHVHLSRSRKEFA